MTHKITCTRRLNFCAGHRVLGHEGKCASWHGHEYVGLFTAEAESLDALGRVIDFSVLKDRIGGWLDNHWDHGFILFDKDEEMLAASKLLCSHKTYLLPDNPTAENLAAHLLLVICPGLLSGTGIRVTRVLLHETANCSAEVCFDGEADRDSVRMRLRQQSEEENADVPTAPQPAH